MTRKFDKYVVARTKHRSIDERQKTKKRRYKTPPVDYLIRSQMNISARFLQRKNLLCFSAHLNDLNQAT